MAENPISILDIGTGTGVIAMMLAQRFEKAIVHAVEIDASAASTAENNFNQSVFHRRLSVSHLAIEDFAATTKFDLIVSNPPYFVNDFKSAEEKKGIARHTDEAFFHQLIKKVAELLSEKGVFWFVLPVKQAELLVKNALEVGLKPQQCIHLHSDETKPEFRRIVCLGKADVALQTDRFYIYQAEKVYTKAYNELLKAFFLKLK